MQFVHSSNYHYTRKYLYQLKFQQETKHIEWSGLPDKEADMRGVGCGRMESGQQQAVSVPRDLYRVQWMVPQRIADCSVPRDLNTDILDGVQPTAGRFAVT